MRTTSSEIDLFNHDEYGEAYLGMAYHVRDMSQLERMIFEDCALADGRWLRRISMSNRAVPFISGRKSSKGESAAHSIRLSPWPMPVDH